MIVLMKKPKVSKWEIIISLALILVIVINKKVAKIKTSFLVL